MIVTKLRKNFTKASNDLFKVI